MTIRMMHLRPLAIALMLLVAVPACGRFRDGKPGGASSASDAVVSQEVSKDDSEAKLRDLVAGYVKPASREDSEGRATVIQRKPYWYKEYSVYPNGVEGMEVDIQEKDSRTSPYSAKVKLGKQRFATKMHRDRGEAQADDNFLRDTGTETLTFELRNGRWWKAGSLFVAEKTEENVNGEWVPAQEEVERTVASEEKEGNWFNRVWSGVTGR